MSDYDKEHKGDLVQQHKRMAMGVPLDGQTMKSTQTESKTKSQSKGGLSQATKKK